MPDRDAILDALYQDELQRWHTFVALLNRLAEERGSTRRFVVDFSHLAQQPPQRPLSETPPPPPPPPSEPPPIPEPDPQEYRDAVRAWEEISGRRWNGA